MGTVAAPEIDVSLAGADVPDNSVVPYGSTTSGTPISKQFTVNNTGNAPLALSGWTFQYPSGNIIAVSTTTTVGSPTATIAATTLVVPGMTVSGPFPVGTAVVSITGNTVTFSAPALTAVTNSYISYFAPGVPVVSPFRFEGTLPTSVAAGASANFTLTYAPMAAGNHTMIARFTTNDLSENPYMFTVTGSSTGVAPAPEIGVSLNGVDTPLASTVAYGSTATGTPVTKQFVISNTGTAALTLSGWSFINPAPYSFVTATLTAGSTTATLNTTSGVTAGMVVAGPFPVGTTLVSLNGTTATFSSAATSTLTSTLTLYPAGTNTVNPFVFSGTLPSTIAPGATAPLTVVFSPQLAGSYAMNLRFTNNDTDENPYQLTLTGTSVGAPPAPEIGVSQGGNDVPVYSSISYGSIVSGTTASKTYVISNTGTATLSLSGWSIMPSATSTSVATTTTLGSTIATVASSAALTPGMVVTGPFPAGTTVVSVSGTLVTFSAAATSTVANAVYSYYPSGTSTVIPFRFDGTLPSSVAPGSTASFTLTYAPTAVGNHSAWVRVYNNDSDENPFQITATGSASAAPVAPHLRPNVNVLGDLSNNATLAFGTVAGGVAATSKSLLLINSGTAPLTISGIGTSLVSSVPAGLPNAFGCSATTPPITLVPNSSYVCTLTFVPTNAGDYNGVIQITSNDPTQGVFTINLTGTCSSTVTAPRIGVSQGGADVPQNGTVSYGSTTSGSLVSKQFTVTNTGNATLSINGFGFNQPFGTVISATLTATVGSAVGTLASANSSIVPGMTVGLPFPIGTSVVSVSGTSVTFSAPALNSMVNGGIGFYPANVPILNPFRLDGSYPTTIAPGATGTFTITYAPVSAGNHTMILILTNNDAGHGAYQCVLSGSATGVAPVPEIGVSVGGVDAPEASTVTFPAATTGVATTKQFVISNTGSANLTLTGWSLSNPAPYIGTFVTTTVGSTSGTLISANPSLSAGMVVSGSNLPINTTITSISGTAVTFSSPASSSVTNIFVQIYPVGTNMINPFAFSGALPSSVAPGATATVSVVFNASLPGTYSQNLRVTTNDPDENPFQLTLTGTASGTPLIPDIAVFSGTTSTTELAQNAAIDFGPITRGNIVYKDLVIKNLGTATLTYGYGYATVLPTPAPTTSAFYTYFAPVTSIAPGGTTTLRVAFKPLALSTAYSTKLTFNSNDPDENPFTLTLTGTSLATDSEIGITTDGANVPNNGSIGFGSVELDSSVTKTLVISNTGDGPLAMTGWSLAPATTTTGTSTTTPPPYVIGLIPGSIAPGASVNVTVTYRPLLVATDNYVLTLFNSDADEGTYKIYLSGISVASSAPSEVNIAVDGTDVASGGTVALSTALNVALNKDVVITNTGTGTLLIGGWSHQSVLPGITTVLGPPTSIPPGGTGVWKIKFLPTTAGSNYSAKLILYNTDADEGTYVVNLTGATTP